MRIRQLVLACQSLDQANTLRDLLSLKAPFADPGVGEFGLTNAVFALGDQFLEIIVPVSPSAPAQRFINRSGEGGYMVLVQTDDLEGLRTHWDAQNIRRVWSCDLDDISANHIHPADIGGAIVSVDEPRPPASWRWGGPDWQDNRAPGRISGADFTSPNPEALAAKWGKGLDLTVQTEDGHPLIKFSDGPIRFLPGKTERLAAFRLHVPDPAATKTRAASLGLPCSGNEISFANTTLILENEL